jgi:dynamin-like GTPase MGM1, mitochondrial
MRNPEEQVPLPRGLPGRGGRQIDGFLNVELLSEFYYNFPRELDVRLGRHLSDAEVERFAREDPKVRRHLDVIRRKDMLEMVLEKIESLRQLEGRAKASVAADRTASAAKQRSKGWSIF